MHGRGLAVASAVLVMAAAPAAAQAPVPARPQTASLDSDAPEGAPPHWLPHERWVMQHWLPYDEERLYGLLGIDRGTVWHALRDDTHTLGELAESRGWRPEALAAALVEPWRGTLRDPGHLRVLERRALRTLTQGHLSQHLFFHSLHQDAVPNQSPRIFGVPSRTEFASLRRSELSPLMICRLYGFSRGHAQAEAAGALKAMAALGVRRQAIPAVQARRLLTRQLSQLPRWLQQTRYNGPPPLVKPRPSAATASNYSNNAELTEDGAHVVFESYDAKLASVKQRGEIAVMAGGPRGSLRRAEQRVPSAPRSTYNPAVSADGRWVAYESAAGNLNFAKRYGEIGIVLLDLRTGRKQRLTDAAGAAPSHSAYNPTVSGDGRLVAFERPGSPSVIVVHDRESGRSSVIRGLGGSDAFEPKLSADGRHLAYTTGPRVAVRDLRSGRTRLVSADQGEAWEPAISSDGRTVAFTALAPGARSSRVVVRRGAGAPVAIRLPWSVGAASEPALSANGKRVAFTARPGGITGSQVFVARVRPGALPTLASRASGDQSPVAFGTSSHPSLSGDGRRVAFTSDAWNLDPGKCNAARGIFVRDLRGARTTLVSAGDGANRYAGPTRGSSSGGDAFVEFLCA